MYTLQDLFELMAACTVKGRRGAAGETPNEASPVKVSLL